MCACCAMFLARAFITRLRCLARGCSEIPKQRDEYGNTNSTGCKRPEASIVVDDGRLRPYARVFGTRALIASSAVSTLCGIQAYDLAVCSRYRGVLASAVSAQCLE